MKEKPVPGTGGDIYIPFSKRSGNESIVYFTRDLSARGLLKAFDCVSANLTGRIGVKLHTGEPHGPNIIPRPWVKNLMKKRLEGANIIETNTFYEGDRDTTEKHLKTVRINGWTFCPVDIMDAEGTAWLPVEGGKWFDRMSVGKNLLNYDSMLALTHFKGHGLRQLSYMNELGMGNTRYVMIDLDNGGQRMYPKDAVYNLKPFGSE